MLQLEVCANSVRSALAAQAGGATRIELCSNMAEGGITPSFAQIKLSVNYLKIPVHVIIRPRGGDFFYSDLEFEEMKLDVQLCGRLAVKGVVFGILRRDGTIDVERNSTLVDLARESGMSVTFHRAFDVCQDQFIALEEIVSLGCDRILTSGGSPVAIEGAQRIKELIDIAAERIIVMPGSGINEMNVRELVTITGARELHASARVKEDRNVYSHPGIATESLFYSPLEVTDPEKVRRLIAAAYLDE